nr:hypothetical protein [Tanacetum cinerariifolium]
RTSPLLSILVFVIPEHNVINPPETVTTASATTISSLLSSLFPHLQQTTSSPTPTTTEATTSTIVDDETNDESKDFNKEQYERINEELYGDVNISLTNAEPVDDEKGADFKSEVPDKPKGKSIDTSEGTGLKPEGTQKTEVLLLSSSISSDYAAKYLNFDNTSPVDTKVVFMLDVNVQHEVPRTSPLLSILVFVIPEHNVINPPETVTTALATTISSFLSSLFPHLQQTTSSPTPTTTEATTSTIDEDAMDEGVANKLKKRKQDDADKDEGPFARSDRGLKRQKTSKDTEPSKKAKSTESSKYISKSQPKSTGKSAEETVLEAEDTQGLQNQGQDMGNTDDQPNVKASPKHDWFKKPKRPPTPDSNWNVKKSVDFRPPQT